MYRSHVSTARQHEMAHELRDSASFMRARLAIGLSPDQVLAQCDTLDSIADQLDGDDGPPPLRLIEGGRAA
ncbi:MAG: hypothetical protein AAGK66_10150 [Pseudomonadota bacterium]